MLMLPLFTGGLLDARSASSSDLERASQFDENEVEGSVSLSVAKAYLLAQRWTDEIRAAKAKVAATDELARTVRLRFDNGKEIEASVARAEAESLESQRLLVQARGEKEKALLSLKEAIGMDLGASIQVLDAPDAIVDVRELGYYLAEARRLRGTLLAAKSRAHASQEDSKAALAASSPQIYAVGMVDGANATGSRGESIGITVSVPIFDGGERRAEASMAKANRDRMDAAVRASELATEREVREEYVDVQIALANLKSASAELESATSAYGISELRVSNGKAPLLEQLDALEVVGRARSELAQAHFDVAFAIARIRRSAGMPLVEGVSK